METKKCIRCDRRLPLTAFYRNNARKDGIHYYCIDCCREINHARAGKRGPNPGTHDSEMPDLERAKRIMAQEGRCALCNEMPPRFVADHDHATKTFRGMLCYSCNLRLGKLEKGLAWYLKALDYISTDWEAGDGGGADGG